MYKVQNETVYIDWLQTTIGEIQQQMQDHHDRNMKLREENQELAGKLKGFIEQYEAREKVHLILYYMFLLL